MPISYLYGQFQQSGVVNGLSSDDLDALNSIAFTKGVSVLEASGNELKAIRKQFTNIRMHDGDHVRWKGDDAQFIATHLKGKG